jgi:hypothetical protein
VKSRKPPLQFPTSFFPAQPLDCVQPAAAFICQPAGRGWTHDLPKTSLPIPHKPLPGAALGLRAACCRFHLPACWPGLDSPPPENLPSNSPPASSRRSPWTACSLLPLSSASLLAGTGLTTSQKPPFQSPTSLFPAQPLDCVQPAAAFICQPAGRGWTHDLPKTSLPIPHKPLPGAALGLRAACCRFHLPACWPGLDTRPPENLPSNSPPASFARSRLRHQSGRQAAAVQSLRRGDASYPSSSSASMAVHLRLNFSP